MKQIPEAVKNMNFTKIGEVGISLNNDPDKKMNIVENVETGKHFVCLDFDKFCSIGSEALKKNQEIRKIISKSIFTPSRCIQCYNYEANEKETFAKIRDKYLVKEIMFNSIIKIGEGADYADNELFCKFDKILYYKSIDDSLYAGFGFEGRGVAVIVAEDFHSTEIIIEHVESYAEGYCVSHFILEEAVFDALLTNSEELKEVYNTYKWYYMRRI